MPEITQIHSPKQESENLMVIIEYDNFSGRSGHSSKKEEVSGKHFWKKECEYTIMRNETIYTCKIKVVQCGWNKTFKINQRYRL